MRVVMHGVVLRLAVEAHPRRRRLAVQAVEQRLRGQRLGQRAPSVGRTPRAGGLVPWRTSLFLRWRCSAQLRKKVVLSRRHSQLGTLVGSLKYSSRSSPELAQASTPGLGVKARLAELRQAAQASGSGASPGQEVDAGCDVPATLQGWAPHLDGDTAQRSTPGARNSGPRLTPASPCATGAHCRPDLGRGGAGALAGGRSQRGAARGAA